MRTEKIISTVGITQIAVREEQTAYLNFEDVLLNTLVLTLVDAFKTV